MRTRRAAGFTLLAGTISVPGAVLLLSGLIKYVLVIMLRSSERYVSHVVSSLLMRGRIRCFTKLSGMKTETL